LNPRIGGREIPVGLIVTVLILMLVAVANLFTKQIATIARVSLTVVLFIVFLISERANTKKAHIRRKALEEFNLDPQQEVAGILHARPGCVLVAVRDYNRMDHLKRTGARHESGDQAARRASQ
jgi:hypothetical protein